MKLGGKKLLPLPTSSQVPYELLALVFFSAGLAGCQNIIERCLMAHSKTISHIYVLFISSIICKFQIALKTALLVSCLRWKSLGYWASRTYKSMLNGSFESYCSYVCVFFLSILLFVSAI